MGEYMKIPHNNYKIVFVELQYMDKHHHRRDVFVEYSEDNNIQVFAAKMIIFV